MRKNFIHFFNNFINNPPMSGYFSRMNGEKTKQKARHFLQLRWEQRQQRQQREQRETDTQFRCRLFRLSRLFRPFFSKNQCLLQLLITNSSLLIEKLRIFPYLCPIMRSCARINIGLSKYKNNNITHKRWGIQICSRWFWRVFRVDISSLTKGAMQAL